MRHGLRFFASLVFMGFVVVGSGFAASRQLGHVVFVNHYGPHLAIIKRQNPQVIKQPSSAETYLAKGASLTVTVQATKEHEGFLSVVAPQTVYSSNYGYLGITIHHGLVKVHGLLHGGNLAFSWDNNASEPTVVFCTNQFYKSHPGNHCLG